MKVPFPRSSLLRSRLFAATAAAALLAIVTVATQSGFFIESYEGELFGVRHELTTPGYPAGVAFVSNFDGQGNERLYVADDGLVDDSGTVIFEPTVIAYDSNGVEVSLPGADWRRGPAADPLSPVPIADPSSPVYGLVPNQLATATVDVVTTAGTVTTTAILVSDSSVNRVMAFDLQGMHLFTMQLDWPGVSYPDPSVQVINGMAMGPAARFTLTQATDTLPPTLTLMGKFAAAWAVDFGQGKPGALLAYEDQGFAYDANAAQFAAPSTALPTVLTDNGNTNEAFGVSFDSAGNLYLVDSFRYTITAYGLNFERLFTFGTPTLGGKTAEFYEPYGMTYWPDPANPARGRLLIADAINSRIVVYRPKLDAVTLVPVDLDPLFAIDLPDPGQTLCPDGLTNCPGQPYAVAVDPLTGRVATSDASGFLNRVWILQTRNLVAYDLHLLDVNNTRVESVCSGDPYSVRFSLTVPAGRPSVAGATPLLTVDGVAITNGTNVGPVNLVAGATQTYTYSLTAPGSVAVPDVRDLPILADASATLPTDVLPRQGVVSVRDCSGLPPTMTATPSVQPQLSGWTPVFPNDPLNPNDPNAYKIILAAAAAVGDNSGIQEIEYEPFGANRFNDTIFSVLNTGNPPGASQTVGVRLVEMGYTTLKFRALSTKGVWSAWQPKDVWLEPVTNRQSDEGQTESFTVGPPHQNGFTYSAVGLPPGMLFDPTTGVISGTLTFAAAGVYSVVMTESAVGQVPTNWAFTWTVKNVNQLPVANDDPYATSEDTVLTVAAPGVLANDTDADTNPLTAIWKEGPSHGALVLNADGSFTYTPDANFNGSDAFAYWAHDGSAVSLPATVTITVNAVNDAPSFTLGAAPAVTEDAGLQTVPGLATAISAGPANESAQAVTFIVSNNNNALFAVPPALTAAGTLTYQPAANAAGSAMVTVQLQDNGGIATGGVDTSAAQMFTITVAAVNDAPVAGADALGATEDTAVTYLAAQLLNNDTDVDGDTLTIAGVTSGAGGTAVLNLDGTVTFTPVANFNGAASFSYTATDGMLTSNSAMVAVTVAAVNDAPVAGADALGATEDTAVTYLAAQLLNNDTDVDGDPLTIARVTSGAGGTAVLNADGTVTFTPVANFNGAASFTYTATDGTLTSDAVTVTVTVAAVADAPVAVADTVPTNEDTPVTYAVLANDQDVDLDSLTIATVTQPATTTGAVTINSDWTVTFTPVANFNGSDTFTYTATDGTLTSNPVTVTVTVAAVNDAPVAGADALGATEDTAVTYLAAQLLNNDTDVDGDTLTIAGVTSGAGGTAVLNLDGTVTFTPTANVSGAASFSYTATDGMLTSNSATVAVTVAAVNDAPVAGSDGYSVIEGTTLTVAAPGVLGNDTDIDNALLFASQVTAPAHGTLVLSGDGSFVYTPTANFNGRDAFTYTASDGLAGSAAATVTFTVLPSNLPPVCSAATVTPEVIWPPNHKPVYLMLGGITDDPQGGPLTIRFTAILQDEPTNGPGQGNTMQDGGIEPDGARAWVRAERSGNSDGRVYLVSFTATDVAGASCAGQVMVGVPHDERGAPAVLSPGRWNSLTGQLVSAPPPPVAVDDAVTVSKGEQERIAVLSNDVANGQPLTVSIVSKPAKGSVKLNKNGTITYKAPSNWTGTTSFSYRASDGFDGSDTAVVNITVTNASHDGDDDDHGSGSDDCGDADHDHAKDSDNRDRDHKRGDHDRCRHS